MTRTYYSNCLSSFCLCFSLFIFFVLQVGCLAARIEAQAAVSSRKVAVAEAALESKRDKLPSEKVEVSKAFNGAMAVISQKEGELNARSGDSGCCSSECLGKRHCFLSIHRS